MPAPHSHANEPGAAPTGDVSRRTFMAAGVGAAAVSAVSFYWCEEFGDPQRRAEVEPTPPGAPGKTFSEAEMRTASAACRRLLPSSPGAPGAQEVNAVGYLDAVLATEFVSAKNKSVILDGLGKLDTRVQALGVREFSLATAPQQDAAIKVFERFTSGGAMPGHKWLRLMLRYIFEAFLGDPVHGGNPGEIGWKWIHHTPGTPRPTTPGWKPKARGA
jgi:hypothetical protein